MDTRWWVLLWLCATAFVSEFFSQETSVLVQRLTGTADACHDKTDTCLNLDVMEFSTIVSVHSWAAALSALISGAVIDRYGTKVALWLTAGCFIVGPLLYTMGAYASSTSGSLALLTFGRIIFGFSSGANSTITNRIKAGWFFYKELGLSFSAQILCDRLGSACAFVMLGAVLPAINMRGVMWLTVGMASIGAIFTITVAYLDNRRGDDICQPEDIFNPLAEGHRGTLWNTIRNFEGLFWCFCVIVFFYYGAVTAFTANGPNFLAQSYGFSESTSSYITGVVYAVGLLTPLVGHLLDRYGYREYWTMGSTSVLFLSFFLLLVIPQFPAVLLVLLVGLGYATIGPLVWTSITLVVNPQHVGFALGLGKFFHYTDSGTTTAIEGAVLNSAGSRLNLPWLVFFVLLTVMAASCIAGSFIVLFLNRRTGHRLTISQGKRGSQMPAQETTPL